ncbi:MAG: hypothetical protein ACFFAN_07370 [Promethearchaeota archaeon]
MLPTTTSSLPSLSKSPNAGEVTISSSVMYLHNVEAQYEDPTIEVFNSLLKGSLLEDSLVSTGSAVNLLVLTVANAKTIAKTVKVRHPFFFEYFIFISPFKLFKKILTLNFFYFFVRCS